MRSNLKLDKDGIEIIEVEPLEKKDEIIKIENLNELINYLVFDVNDIKRFKSILNKQKKELIKHFKNNNNTLKLVEQYIETVKDETVSTHQLINTSKTISYIINSDIIKISNKEKHEILRTLNVTCSKLSSKKYTNRERKKIRKYLTLLINDINKNNIKGNYLANINNKYGINEQFSSQVIEELDNVVKSYDKQYVDMRNKHVFTIDTSSNCCCEDAMSFEQLPNGNYLLGVYIIDVYSYINSGSLLELEALNRGKSIYLPGLNLPMFPTELVYDYLTLEKNKTKCVVANLYEFSSSFNLINHDIKRAIVNIRENRVYSEVEKDLNNGITILENDLFDKLLLLVEKIKHQNPSVKNYHTKKETNNNYTKNQSQLIEYLMIYTNHLSADKYSQTQYPFLYRVNLDPKSYYKNLKIDGQNEVVKNVIDELKSFPNKSFYSADNRGHFGLNLKTYAHTTTPTRNFSSLQNQKLIQKILIDKQRLSDSEVYELKDQLNIMSHMLNEKDKLINAYTEEYMYHRRKKR